MVHLRNRKVYGEQEDSVRANAPQARTLPELLERRAALQAEMGRIAEQVGDLQQATRSQIEEGESSEWMSTRGTRAAPCP